MSDRKQVLLRIDPAVHDALARCIRCEADGRGIDDVLNNLEDIAAHNGLSMTEEFAMLVRFGLQAWNELKPNFSKSSSCH